MQKIWEILGSLFSFFKILFGEKEKIIILKEEDVSRSRLVLSDLEKEMELEPKTLERRACDTFVRLGKTKINFRGREISLLEAMALHLQKEKPDGSIPGLIQRSIEQFIQNGEGKNR